MCECVKFVILYREYVLRILVVVISHIANGWFVKWLRINFRHALLLLYSIPLMHKLKRWI